MSNAEDVSTKNIQSDSGIEIFADIVTSMSRFLTRFTSIEPFKEAQLGLAEWLGLMVLTSRPGLSNKQFAKLLGTTVQRAAQISDALKRANLISVDQAENDARTYSMKVTASGAQRLSELNGKLTPLITSGLGSRVTSLPATRRNLTRLLRVVTPTKNSPGSGKAEDAKGTRKKAAS